MNTKPATDLELAEVPLEYARTGVRDLVQKAYDAGLTVYKPSTYMQTRPSADEVNKAVQAVERGAVVLAHARMEYVAKACGFEGLTEALGYLQTLRANPLADLLREAVNLCAVGDITETEDASEQGGWGNWLMRAKAVVGDKPPPALEALGDGPMLDNLTTQQEMCVAEIAAVVDREPEVLSGCAVRATIQREHVNGSQTGDAPADAPEAAAPTNRHGQTCAQTCGDMAAGGFHSALCHTIEAITGGAPTSKH